MSKPIRYDALLVRELANELESRLGGARLHSALFTGARRTLRLATGRGTIAWSVHPQTGGLTLARPTREQGNLPVRAGSRITSVRAMPDERMVEFLLHVPDADPAAEGLERIVVELFGTHSNAFAIDTAGIILAALRRGTGSRPLARGSRWVPPPSSDRRGVDAPLDRAAFRSLLGTLVEAERKRALVAAVAWTSPINAGPVLGRPADNDGEEALESAYGRYVDVCHGPVSPVLLDIQGCLQPYPRPLPGIDGESVADLLTAFATAGAGLVDGGDAEAALAAIAAKRKSIRRRCDRLRSEQEGAQADADRLRRDAGLLLSQAHAVDRGRKSVALEDFRGGTVHIDLDPALDAAANAERLYDRARRRERAGRRIPEILETAEAEDSRLNDLADRIRGGSGTVPAETLERLARPQGKQPGKRPEEVRLPYRRFQSRNGLEIRVGRGARFNDQLTLRHARPDDIWLHARDVGGAHVVLVWGRRDQNPPESDIRDAAVLAALHSRARTSGTVPVDWTRRKYVRKPRKTPPGTVTLERAKTMFVRPDPEVAERLRVPADQV